MRLSRLTEKESLNLSQSQLSSLGIGLAKGEFTIEDVGQIFPGAVMVQDLEALKLTYMNSWGCEHLDHSLDDLVAMGDEYYSRFFYEDERRMFLPRMISYVQKQDATCLYTFYQRLRGMPAKEGVLYYTSCKLQPGDHSLAPSKELVVISNPVAGINQTINKLSKLLQENEWAIKNRQRFLLLTTREKEIISLLAEGRPSAEIADALFISLHTVNTHRKNIWKKLEIDSFAELFKFANAFDLVRY